MAKNIIKELPELVSAGIISPDTSDKIKLFYQQQVQKQPDRSNVIFGVLGSLLVGLGLILIVAHNWDELSRPVKVILSFIPLLIGQLLCGYTLLKKQGNQTWKESSGCFLFFAVGASLSLIAQLYHIPGNLTSFLFTWMLLCFPLIYIMPSSLCSLLYLVGITAYSVGDGFHYSGLGTSHYWWLFVLFLPHYFWLILKKPESNFTFYHHLLSPLSLTISLGTLLSGAGEYATIAYVGLFAIFYLTSVSAWFPADKRMDGYMIIGSVGSMLVFFMASFRDFWERLPAVPGPLTLAAALAIFVPALVAIGLSILYFKQKRNTSIQPGLMLVAFYFIYFIGRQDAFLGALLMNLLLLATAISIIRYGMKSHHFGILNFGLLLIAILVICRFFDTDISFVLRGLSFVLVGAGFFFANKFLISKSKGV